MNPNHFEAKHTNTNFQNINFRKTNQFGATPQDKTITLDRLRDVLCKKYQFQPDRAKQQIEKTLLSLNINPKDPISSSVLPLIIAMMCVAYSLSACAHTPVSDEKNAIKTQDNNQPEKPAPERIIEKHYVYIPVPLNQPIDEETLNQIMQELPAGVRIDIQSKQYLDQLLFQKPEFKTIIESPYKIFYSLSTGANENDYHQGAICTLQYVNQHNINIPTINKAVDIAKEMSAISKPHSSSFPYFIRLASSGKSTQSLIDSQKSLMEKLQAPFYYNFENAEVVIKSTGKVIIQDTYVFLKQHFRDIGYNIEWFQGKKEVLGAQTFERKITQIASFYRPSIDQESLQDIEMFLQTSHAIDIAINLKFLFPHFKYDSDDRENFSKLIPVYNAGKMSRIAQFYNVLGGDIDNENLRTFNFMLTTEGAIEVIEVLRSNFPHFRYDIDDVNRIQELVIIYKQNPSSFVQRMGQIVNSYNKVGSDIDSADMKTFNLFLKKEGTLKLVEDLRSCFPHFRYDEDDIPAINTLLPIYNGQKDKLLRISKFHTMGQDISSNDIRTFQFFLQTKGAIELTENLKIYFPHFRFDSDDISSIEQILPFYQGQKDKLERIAIIYASIGQDIDNEDTQTLIFFLNNSNALNLVEDIKLSSNYYRYHPEDQSKIASLASKYDRPKHKAKLINLLSKRRISSLDNDDVELINAIID